MRSYFVTFRSITFAQRGQSLLALNNIDAALLRTPKWMQERGCGYCLKMKQEQAWPAVQILQENKVNFNKVYVQRENGEPQEVKL